MVTSRKFPRLPGRSVELPRAQVTFRDAVCLGLPDGLGEHLGLGVHADGFSDVLCERESQLAGAAAQVEQAPGAVEVELPGEVVDERLWIAWPISCVVPGGSCEQVAF